MHTLRHRRLVGIGFLAAVIGLAGACSPQPGDGPPPGTGECRTILEYPLDTGTSWTSAPTISADGKRAAYVRDGRIVVRDVASGTERDITGDLGVGLPFGSLRISADGKSVGVTLPGIVRADRDGYIIDAETGGSRKLPWTGAQWVSGVTAIGFSADLSAFVFRDERPSAAEERPQEKGVSTYLVVPSDGSSVRSVRLLALGPVRLNADASVIAAGTEANYKGSALTYTGPDADSAWIADLNRAGDRALVMTSRRAYLWHLKSGVVESLPMAPGEAFSDPSWARSSEDGRFIVRTGVLTDGNWAVWRFDRATGQVTPLPRTFDGVTGISDDGRLITATNRSLFRCSPEDPPN